MTVGLVGTGPAAAAVEAALGDVDRAVERVALDAVDTADAVVVVDQVGADTFERAGDLAREADLPLFTVELGGVGGYPLVDAAVAGFAPDGACYRCLAARVRSNAGTEADPARAPAGTDTALESAETGTASATTAPTARFAGALAGRRVLEHLNPTAPDRLGSVVELPRSEREIHPVPGCECGEGRDRVLDWGHVERTVDQSLGRAERALDSRVGLVSEVGEAESYPAPYYLAQLCDTAAFADATAGRQAAGVDPGWDAAFMKALGEGLERYCAGVYREREFRTAAATDLADAVAPSGVVRPAEWGPAGPGDRGENGVAGPDARERPWIRGADLASREPVSLPAELVHYPPPERTIRPAVTTGLGLGNSTVEAVLSGLYEVVERDATTLAWYSTYDPLELGVEDDAYDRLARRAGAEDLDATALLLTQDVDVPVVAVAVTREEFPRLALGTAAHLDAEAAARNALAEAVQNWVELREMGTEGAESVDGAVGRYAADPGPAASFVDPEGSVPAASVGPETVPEGGDHLEAVVDRVTDAGLDAYAARTTTRDVQRIGFEAVRVVVPAAQPLFFDQPYFGARARTVPESLGFEPTLDRGFHPYP